MVELTDLQHKDDTKTITKTAASIEVLGVRQKLKLITLIMIGVCVFSPLLGLMVGVAGAAISFIGAAIAAYFYSNNDKEMQYLKKKYGV